MIFIVYDLEATCWDGNPPSQVQEIIEIGAYKLNGYGEVMDSFSRLVKPVIHPYLSFYCRKLTGIEQDEINRASSFGKVIDDFQDWIDIYENQDLLIKTPPRTQQIILIVDIYPVLKIIDHLGKGRSSIDFVLLNSS